MSDTLSAALEYAERGWAVFPLDGKVPAIESGFKAASTDPELIRYWFNDTGFNVGVAIPEGHVVLDIDPRAGGPETLREIRDQLPKSTLVAKTGRGDGGLHIWFRGEIPKVKLPGIDIKRPGKGYVVAPPSVHPDTGGAYEWRNYGTPIADFEGEIQYAQSNSLIGVDLNTSGTARESAESAEPILKGVQHDTLLEVAAYAISKYPPAIARMVYDSALQRCEPAHPRNQAESIWNWVCTRQESGDGFVDDDLAPEPETPEPDPEERRFVPIDWEELLTGEIPEPDWLLEPLIEAGRQVALYSDAKAGKSLLLLEAACGVATGKAVLGDIAREPRPVVYLDMENTTDDLRERIDKLGYGWQELTGRLFYYSFPSLKYLDTPEGGREVYSIAIEHDAALVVIDTLSRVTEGDENENDTYHNFYKSTGVPLKRAGIGLIRLDHAGKDVGKGMRGASAKTTDVDAVWSLLIHEEDTLTLERTHTRAAHGAGKLTLERKDNPLRHVLPEAPFDTEIGAPSGPNLEQNRVELLIGHLEHLGLPPNTSVKASREALREAGIPFNAKCLDDAVRQRKSDTKPLVSRPFGEEGFVSEKLTPKADTKPDTKSENPRSEMVSELVSDGDTEDHGQVDTMTPTTQEPLQGAPVVSGSKTPYQPYVVPFDLEAVMNETAEWSSDG